MIRITLCALCMMMAGCASTGPKLNCDQSCALQNMVCTGQSMGESSGASTNLSTLATSAGSSSNLTYHCAKDESKAAQISKYKDQATGADGTLPASERWKCVPTRMRENEEYRKLCESHQQN